MAYANFQPAQPNAIRQLNRKFNGNEQLRKSKPKRSHSNGDFTNKSGAELNAWQVASQFGERTTIHGLNRLLGDGSGKYERVIWLMAVLFALLSAVYVGLLVSRRYNEGNFQTVVDSTRFPVYRIAFPTVTICNANRLNWDRLPEAKQRFLPNETSPEKLQLFEDIVGTYDGLRFAGFDKFEVLRGKPVELLNHVNFSNVVDFMTWRCNEMFTDCFWRNYAMDCCEIFSKRRSKNGFCWSFNTLETDEGRLKQKLDDLYPWRSSTAGPRSALFTRVMVHPEKHYPNRLNEKGISVMISEPLAWHTSFFDIAVNTQTMVEIDPVIYYYDNDTRGTPSSQRECVFNDEHNSKDFKSLVGYIYMVENCISECHQEYLTRYCNCTMDLFFPPGQYKPCHSKDFLCLAENNEYFKYSAQPGAQKFIRNEYEGMVCKCFRNCYSLSYITDVRPSFLPAEIHQNKSYIDLDVHYRFTAIMVYRTSLVFGWVDLMVSFGGIAGLFLGCSLISVIELSYFALVEMPKFLVDKVRSKFSSHNQFKLNMKSSSLQPLRSPDPLEKFFTSGQFNKNLSMQKNQFNQFKPTPPPPIGNFEFKY